MFDHRRAGVADAAVVESGAGFPEVIDVDLGQGFAAEGCHVVSVGAGFLDEFVDESLVEASAVLDVGSLAVPDLEEVEDSSVLDGFLEVGRAGVSCEHGRGPFSLRFVGETLRLRFSAESSVISVAFCVCRS